MKIVDNLAFTKGVALASGILSLIFLACQNLAIIGIGMGIFYLKKKYYNIILLHTMTLKDWILFALWIIFIFIISYNFYLALNK
jgi:hypothetical protein